MDWFLFLWIGINIKFNQFIELVCPWMDTLNAWNGVDNRDYLKNRSVLFIVTVLCLLLLDYFCVANNRFLTWNKLSAIILFWANTGMLCQWWERVWYDYLKIRSLKKPNDLICSRFFLLLRGRLRIKVEKHHTKERIILYGILMSLFFAHLFHTKVS